MIFLPSERDRAILYLDKLFERRKHVKIDPITESKTLSQNSYLWLVFTHVAFETGSNKDDMYLYWLNKFPKYKEITFQGEVCLVSISLSSFTKEQTSVFIDEVVTDARQEGFQVPDPEDKKALEMFQYYKNLGLI
jgi:hypothetical protein